MSCFLVYSQHLSGTGHFVRMWEIACTLAQYHSVYFIDGGRPIPRPTPIVPYNLVSLPPIYRSATGLTPLDTNRHLDDVMAERKQHLQNLIDEIQPDVIIIEHFPFSKWVLYSEIISLIEQARIVNNRVKIICSIRDLPVGTCDEPNQTDYQTKVTTIIERYFDHILIHADPNIIDLATYIPWLKKLALPVHYTGYVSQKLSDYDDRKAKENLILVSAGGIGGIELISNSIEAWEKIKYEKQLKDYRLIIFAPLFIAQKDWNSLEKQIKNTFIQLKSFEPNFIHWMSKAKLSISQAGYNTCMNILETRRPSILVPNPKMFDQIVRAKRLAELDLVTSITPQELTPANLVEMITYNLSNRSNLSKLSCHSIDLDGSRKTCKILES